MNPRPRSVRQGIVHRLGPFRQVPARVTDNRDRDFARLSWVRSAGLAEPQPVVKHAPYRAIGHVSAAYAARENSPLAILVWADFYGAIRPTPACILCLPATCRNLSPPFQYTSIEGAHKLFGFERPKIDPFFLGDIHPMLIEPEVPRQPMFRHHRTVRRHQRRQIDLLFQE